MDTRLLREIRLIAGLVPAPTRMPPEPFSKMQLTQLYSKINDRYDYGTFNFLPDGARIAHREESQILVQTGLIQLNEGIPLDFVPIKQKFVDIMNMITESLRLSQFLTLGIKLICHLPGTQPIRANELIETKFISIDEEGFKSLGDGRLGTGLRFHFNTPESYWDLRIEPLFWDLTKLYIEMDKHYKHPFSGLSTIEGGMQSVRDYIFSEVRSLLESKL